MSAGGQEAGKVHRGGPRPPELCLVGHRRTPAECPVMIACPGLVDHARVACEGRARWTTDPMPVCVRAHHLVPIHWWDSSAEGWDPRARNLLTSTAALSLPFPNGKSSVEVFGGELVGAEWL